MRAPEDHPLDPASVHPDPMHQFRQWFDEARGAGIDEPEAMALASAGPGGRPSVRMVLMRGLDERGLVFFTNYQSRKGRELDATGQAAAVFHWPLLQRQVRVEGRVQRVSAADSDAYFSKRPLGSRYGAAASPQSEVIPDRRTIVLKVAQLMAAHPLGRIPRPAHWGGYRIEPEALEFWQGRRHRLHDRVRYRREDGRWIIERLAP
jgi:pyridoxamine 5'-phosphate oxidase